MIATVYNEGDEKSLQNFLASLSYIMLMWKVLYRPTVFYSLLKFHSQNLYNIIARESRTVSLSYYAVHVVGEYLFTKNQYLLYEIPQIYLI